MQTKIKFPAKRFMLLLFLCSSLVILLQNYDLSESTSFMYNIVSMLLGVAVSFLFFIPSIIIKRKTDLDFMSFAHIKTPSAIIFISLFYCAYFVYTAEYFLLRYMDMFSQKLNSEANIYAVALFLLAVCIYAAYKGTNAIARCSIFIFLFALVSFILIFTGNISNVKVDSSIYSFKGSMDSLLNNALFFTTSAFTAVIFATLSGFTKNFRQRQVLFTTGFSALLFGLIMFFVAFALGKYSTAQSYQTFLLSKSAHIGGVNGFDSLYLSLSVLIVLLVISLLLTCIGKSVGKSGSLSTVVVFTAIIYVLFICSGYFNSVKEILTDKYIFVFLTLTASVVIPSVYLIVFGRKDYD